VTRLSTLALLATLAVAGCGQGSGGEKYRPLAVGDPAPAFAVPTLTGDTARVAAGQPVTLVNVWATWCIPCQQEFADLERIHRDYAPRGLRVVAVSMDRGDAAEQDVREFVAERGATFTVGLDPRDRVRALYGSLGVPESYLVSADGRLLWRQIGAFPEGAAAARRAIEQALAGKAQSRPATRRTARAPRDRPRVSSDIVRRDQHDFATSAADAAVRSRRPLRLPSRVCGGHDGPARTRPGAQRHPGASCRRRARRCWPVTELRPESPPSWGR
jgi:thiol-disulfide isomerase/thioredoxin